MAALLFAPLESSVSSSFWTELARLKLDELRLSELPLDVAGAFAAPCSRAQTQKCCSRGCCAGFLSAASRAELASPLHVEAASLQPVRRLLTRLRRTADSEPLPRCAGAKQAAQRQSLSSPWHARLRQHSRHF